MLGIALLVASHAPALAVPIGQAFKGAEVRGVRVHGVAGDLADELRRGLALSGEDRLFGRTRPRFFPETLESDLARALLFLARNGLPYATIEPRLSSDRRRRAVTVHLDVTPGPRVRIQSVSISGLPESFDAPAIRLEAGAPLVDADLARAARALTAALQQDGYAQARVATALEQTDSTRVNVALNASHGARYTVHQVDVEGVPDDLARVARTRVPLQPGDRYSPQQVQDGVEGIRRLNLFRRIESTADTVGGDRLRVRYELSERAQRTVQAGMGYFSDDLLRGSVLLEHRNLLSGGRGGRVSAEASKFLQRAGGELWLPSLLGSRTRGLLGVFARRENETAYLLQSLRAEFFLHRDVWRSFETLLGVRVSYIAVDARTSEPDLETPEGVVTTLDGLVKWERTDDRLYPTRGMLWQLEAESTVPGLQSVTEYVRSEGQASAYRPLVGGAVLAGRVHAGAARPLGDTRTLLANRRFFAGGSRSVRGFERRDLGPRDAEGKPLGGEFVAEASIEVRFPVFGPVFAAGFVDGGQVWAAADHAQVDAFEFAAGPALMFRTPVGPVRLDLGFRLGPGDDRPNRVLHFSVGNPF